jgi:hypothetical protein
MMIDADEQSRVDVMGIVWMNTDGIDEKCVLSLSLRYTRLNHSLLMNAASMLCISQSASDDADADADTNAYCE